MKKNLFGILLISILITACSIQVSQTTPYTEPSVSSNYAIVKLKNDSQIGFLVNEVIRKPNNQLRFSKIDNQRLGFFHSDTMRLTPGLHHLMITCTAFNRAFGEAAITINAMPGRTYEIAYPANLYGYDVDYTACQKLIVR